MLQRAAQYNFLPLFLYAAISRKIHKSHRKRGVAIKLCTHSHGTIWHRMAPHKTLHFPVKNHFFSHCNFPSFKHMEPHKISLPLSAFQPHSYTVFLIPDGVAYHAWSYYSKSLSITSWSSINLSLLLCVYKACSSQYPNEEWTGPFFGTSSTSRNLNNKRWCNRDERNNISNSSLIYLFFKGRKYVMLFGGKYKQTQKWKKAFFFFFFSLL